MKRKTVCFLVIAAICVVCFPLLLDWLVFGNSLSSNVSNETWASFLGSYSGAVLGGIISLFGIILTIRFTQTENQEQRRIQVAPYLNISFKRMSELISPKKQLDYILFNYDPNSSKQLNLFGIITLKNVGFGPMLNCCVSDVRFNDKSVPRPVPVLTQNALEPKGEYTISIGLRAEDGELDPSLIRKFPPGELLEDKPVFGAIDNKGAGRLSFYLCYQDILGNPYQQKISVEVQIVCEQSPNGPRKYVPSISLSEVGEREMRNTALKNRLVPIVLRSNSKEE